MIEKLIPIALSSQLDVTGEERVHAAKYTPVVRQVYVPSAVLVPVVLWSDYIASGGIGIDPDQAFNSEVATASTGVVTGYYTPYVTIADEADTYPPPTDPLLVDLSGYTLVPVTPVVLTTGNSGPGIAIWYSGYPTVIPDGKFYATVSIDGAPDILACLAQNAGN